MERYAELEISLHRRAEGEYAAEFRYSQPDSAVDARLGEQGRIALDTLTLRALTYDPQAYAQSLTGCFFSDPEIKTQLARVRSSAEALNLPLRVRLLIGPSAPELHGVYWEQLLDPDDGAPLFTGEKIVFSRYLSSLNLRPVKLGPKTGLSALVFIANPSNLADNKRMAPIDADQEFERALQGLEPIPAARFAGGPATLNNLVEALRAQNLRAQQPTILYLVCHGGLLRDEPYLWLEDAGGQVAVTPAKELVTRLKELNEPPLLVVLASCDSAGLDSAGDARAAFGPRFAEAGIPAVVAMQGSVTMETVAEFMPVFFRALQEDGQVDRAMALARGAVRERYDHWMPVLFTRLKTGCLFAAEREAAAARKPRTWRFWAAIAGAALIVLAAAFGAFWYASRPPWMGDGFNVVLATFTEVDATGRERVTDRSRQISAWLHEDINQEKANLSQILRFELLPPERAGAITGADRAGAVLRLAQQTNASLVIFGRLEDTGAGYLVLPEFYVSDRASFEYGSEIAGADRLGKAVPLGTVIDEKTAGSNPDLKVRARVLRSIMKGLALLSTGSYEDAESAFRKAAYDTDWPDEEGKEVAFVLLGAAQTMPYDPKTNRDVLVAAEASFVKARELNPDYARPYLGLGEIRLLSATIDKGPQGQADLLKEAETLFHMAQERAEPGSLNSIKAAFQLGRTAMLRFDARLPGWKPEDAFTAEQGMLPVISAYEAGDHGLAYHAAEARLMLSRLAGWGEDWKEMVSQARLAVDALDPLTGSRALAMKARCWEYVALAEKQRGNVEAAREAYRQALDTGKIATAEPTEMKRWEDAYNSLEKGVP